MTILSKLAVGLPKDWKQLGSSLAVAVLASGAVLFAIKYYRKAAAAPSTTPSYGNWFELEMPLESRNVGAVIGLKGQTLRRIEAETNTTLNVEPEETSPSTASKVVTDHNQNNAHKTTRIIIRGERENVFRAKIIVENILRQCSKVNNDTTETLTFTIPSEAVGWTIGKNGKMTKRITQTTGVSVWISQEGNGDTETVRLTGHPMALPRAKEMILDRIKQLPGWDQAGNEEYCHEQTFLMDMDSENKEHYW